MITAMALFVVNDALVKLATTAYPTSQVLAVRGVFASSVALALVFAFRQSDSLGLLLRPQVTVRALMEGVVAFTFITALAFLQLANITAILQSSSLIIIVLAAFLGIERMDWKRWLAVAIGFAGVLLIVRPRADGFNVYSLLALVSAAMVAIRDLMTRRIAVEIPTAVVALGTTLGVTLLGVVIGFGEIWRPLAWRETLYLVLAAIVVSIGNTCIIIAYRNGEISTISSLRYTVLVFALVGGFLVLGEWPDALALIGASLIVGSGLYALRRQRLGTQAAGSAVT